MYNVCRDLHDCACNRCTAAMHEGFASLRQALPKKNQVVPTTVPLLNHFNVLHLSPFRRA